MDIIDRNRNKVSGYINSEGKKELLLKAGNTDFVFINIPGGDFMMGSPDNVKISSPDEKPWHCVRLSHDFWLGKFPVTIEQWEAIMMDVRPYENKDYSGRIASCPATHIAFDDALTFISRIKEHTGLPVRLPREAEWEYAARAGSRTRYFWGDEDTGSEIGKYSWYYGNTGAKGLKSPQPVGQKLPNNFGLHDMAGNVWEWCEDFYSEDYYRKSCWIDPKGPVYGMKRVLRGGSWGDDPKYLGSAVRDSYYPYKRWYLNGFRLCLENLN